MRILHSDEMDVCQVKVKLVFEDKRLSTMKTPIPRYMSSRAQLALAAVARLDA